MENTENPKGSKYHVPNLERALVIMEALANSQGGMGISDICEELGFSKNSIYRITQTLYNNGYLNRSDESKKFTLSRKLLVLGYAAICEQNLLEHSLDIMRELRDEVDVTVLIGSLLDYEGVVLGQAPGGHPFKLTVEPGTRFELYSGAPGKIFMAYAPEKEQDYLLKMQSFKKITDNTITSAREMRAELERVKIQGYALDKNEGFSAINCVAAPIFDNNNSVIAAIWVTGAIDQVPTEDLNKLGELIKEYALRISNRLGYDLI